MDLLRVGKYLVAGEVTETNGSSLTFQPRFKIDENRRLLTPLQAGKISTSPAFLINTSFEGTGFVEASDTEDYSHLVHESMLPFAVYGRSIDLGGMKLISYSRSSGFIVEQQGNRKEVTFRDALTCVQLGQAMALEALKPRIRALGLFEGLDKESVTEGAALLTKSMRVYLKVEPFRDITTLGEGTSVAVLGYYQGRLVLEADGEMVWRPIEEAEYYDLDVKDDDYYFSMDSDRDGIQDPLQALPSKPALARTARAQDNWNVQPHQVKVSGHFSSVSTISNDDYRIFGESYLGTHGFEDDERQQRPEIHDVDAQPGSDPVSGGESDIEGHMDDIASMTGLDDDPASTPQDYSGEQGAEGMGIDDGVDEAKSLGGRKYRVQAKNRTFGTYIVTVPKERDTEADAQRILDHILSNAHPKATLARSLPKFKKMKITDKKGLTVELEHVGSVGEGAKADKVKQAILSRVSGGGDHELSDIARSLTGIHFKAIQGGAKALAKAGQIKYDGVSTVSLEEARDYKKEYSDYHGTTKQVKNRSTRNQARRKMELETGDEREVDHSKPLSQGGTNHGNNLKVVSRAKNRAKGAKYEAEDYPKGKCSQCGNTDELLKGMCGDCHKNNAQKAESSESKPKKTYGVFPHAENGSPTGRGYVTRTLDEDGSPEDMKNYGTVPPVRTFKRESAAEKHANTLTFGEAEVLDGLLASISEGADLDHVLGGLADPKCAQEAYRDGLKKVFPDHP